MARSGSSNDVLAIIECYPRPARDKLLELRDLIFQTAEQTDGVGEIEECLKWGQPSYLTSKTKSGSTIRMDAVKKDEAKVALYFHCQTSLVPTFRELYSDDLAFEGNRAVILDAAEEVPTEVLAHCIGLALTYHKQKKKSA